MANVAFEAFKGLFIPYRLQMVLAGSEQTFFSAEPDNEAEHTYLHETIHWWQTAMTGYGHSSWSIFRQLTSFAVNEWVQGTASSPGGRLFSLRGLTTPPTRQNVQLLAARVACESTLALANARFRQPDGRRTMDAISPLRFRNCPWEVSPRVHLDGIERYLNGVDVIEAHAHFVSSQFSQIFRGAKAETFMLPGLSDKYWFAFIWFCKTAGERFAHLFPMVCDLALMTIWNDTLNTEGEWRATSPAWRFVTLTNSLSQVMSDRFTAAQLADDYRRLANRLLDVCGYATLDAVISAALSRESWRMPLMQLEKRMFEAMRFRKANPWCVAYPWLVSDVFETMHQKFPVPIMQVEGKLKANSHFPELNDDATNFMSEIGLELMLQAWALQLLEVPPATTAPEGTIQCGFRYFDIENVCPHQIADGCPGSFKPADGSPHPADLSDEDTLLGCPFEKILALKGVAVRSIKLPEHNERNDSPMR